MQDQNSYVEFILGIFRAQLVDCACWYPELSKEFNRDYDRLCSAVYSHGIRFALDTMPAFRKHLDKCLSEGHLTPSHLLHFGVVKKGEAIPRLFRGLTSRVFDRNGRLKDQPDIEAIRWLRQLLGVVRKLKMSSNIRDSGNTVRDFYRTDMEVRSGHLSWDDHVSFSEEVERNDKAFVSIISPDQHLTADLLAERPESRTPVPICDLRRALVNLQRVADYIASSLGSFDPHKWVFRHGPGAVADHSFGAYKYEFRRWPERLDSTFPYSDFAIANFDQVVMEPIEEARARGFTHEPPARMCAVPKTIKAPRLIACEPVSLQWCQQAIRDFFYSRTKRTFISKFVDYQRQELNGFLALEASHSQSHSTIDLSSASDRVSCWHVERLFRRSPDLLRALQATRSVWIEQTLCRFSPRFYRLRKFSTMGNATTFPVQTIFFLAISLAAVLTTRGLRVCKRSFSLLKKSEVRVFGDDLIVPKDASGLLIGMLQTLGLKVNDSKTFTKGNFRESCGVDAYDGHDVTSIGVLDLPRRSSPSSVVSTVDVHNNLHSAGYWMTSQFLRKTANLVGYNRIREVKHGDGAFGWYTYGPPDYSGFRTRVNRDLHVREVYCLGPRPKIHRRPAEGSPGLLQFFTEAAKKVTSAKSTLGYLDRRPRSSLALGWAPL